MLKITSFIFLLVFFHNIVFSQDRQVAGLIVNSTGNPISSASVYLISDTDTLFTKSQENGTFLLTGAIHSEYHLVLSALGYKRGKLSFAFKNELNKIVLPTHILKDSSIILREIVIRNQVPIAFKKDTVEYDSESYEVREGAYIDDLIRLMPGMIVNGKGELTYQGEAINTLRVNGKDFFSGDVSSYIRQLPANIISKIQIINDYGLEANLTGLKRQSLTKILNLKFKEDIQVGTFGSINAGISNQKQSRISEGLNYWAGERQVSQNGGLSDSKGLSGLSSDRTSAVTYRDNWSGNIQPNFTYSNIHTEMESENIRDKVSIVPDGIVQINDQNKFYDKNKRHLISASFSFIPNPKIYVAVSSVLNLSSSLNFSELKSKQRGVVFSDLHSFTNSEGKSTNLSTSMFLVRNFKKQYRNFSAKIDLEINHPGNIINGLNNITFDGHQENQSLEVMTFNVLKTTNLRANISYAEPIASNNFLDINYNSSLQVEKNDFSNIVIKKVSVSSMRDSATVSNNNLMLQNDIALVWRYVGHKMRVNLGYLFRWVKLDNSNYNNNSEFSSSPVLSFNYDPNNNHKLTLDYTSNTKLPNYYQLRTVPDNQNVQNTIIGNPNLKSSINHALGFNSSHMTVSGASLRFNSTASFISNQIVMNNILVKDALGKVSQSTTFRNINGVRRFSVGYHLTAPILSFEKDKINFVLSGNFNSNRNPSFVNSQIIINRNNIFDNRLFVQFLSKNVTLSTSITYSNATNNFDLNGSIIEKINHKKIDFNAEWNLKNRTTFSIDASKSLIDGYSVDINSDPFILNFSTNYKVSKRKPFTLSLQAMDLFNQGNTFTQLVEGNQIVESKNKFVTRSFTVSMIYQFNKFSKK